MLNERVRCAPGTRVALVCGLLASFAADTKSQTIPAAEFAARRQALLSRHADGIVLLHARATAASLTDHGFKQDAAFYYFTGLATQPSAVLLLDGPKRESVLFVPDDPLSFGRPVEGVSLKPGATSAFDRVVAWDELTGYLTSRLADGVESFHLDEPRRPVPPGNPDDLLPVAGEHNLWWASLALAFPEAKLVSAQETIREMRWKKSPAEIAVLRGVARATADALREGIRAVRPGVRQRVSEAAVVSGCIAAGGEGPSFWPWTMSGPNAHAENLGGSFYDYRHLDRVMQAGELVRMDIGCDWNHYEGDVGRTIPVSGRFSREQAEAWDLLIAGYRAGLDRMRAGVSRADLAGASRDAVRERVATLETEHAREAARAMLDGGDGVWHVHGVGIEAGEERLPELVDGAVIAYEPGFSVGADAYYLEDMILVTATGHEVLSTGLPYTAEEIDAFMGRR